jgi:hypothetical protein
LRRVEIDGGEMREGSERRSVLEDVGNEESGGTWKR